MGAQSLQATAAKRLEATGANTLHLRRYRLQAIRARDAPGHTGYRPYSLEARGDRG